MRSEAGGVVFVKGEVVQSSQKSDMEVSSLKCCHLEGLLTSVIKKTM